MAYFIPFVLGGTALGVLAWSVRMIWTKDDSADKKAAELLGTIPKQFAKHISQININKKGVSIEFNPGTPQEVEDAIRDNIKPLDT